MKYLWAVAALVVMAGTAEATTRYASNTGTGTAPCTTISPAASRCSVVTGLAQLVAGDTLQLLGNTMTNPAIYQGATAMLVPPVGLSGNSTNRITVQCADISGVAVAGGCLIDGQFAGWNTGNPRRPLNFDTNSWWIIEDINFRQGGSGLFTFFQANNNIFRRIVGWDAPIDRNGTLVNLNVSSDNLFEDFAGFGTARKIFSPFSTGSLRNTCRRCWLRWEGSINVGPKIAVTTNYHADDTTLEDTLVTWNGSQMPQNYTVTNNSAPWDSDGNASNGTQIQTFGSFGIQNFAAMINRDATHGCATSATLTGVIAYLKAGDRYNESAGVQPLIALGGASGGDTAQSCTTAQNTIAVIGNGHTNYANIRGFSFGSTGTQNTYSHLTSAASLADQFTNWTNLDGTPSHGNCVTGSTANACSGSFLTPIADPWTTTGGGANLCYRTNVAPPTPLWPWPMNERIKVATGMAGNYFTNGGPGCGASNGNCSGTLGTTRTATDVTQEIEALLGTIPAACRSSSEEPFPDFTGYPTHGQLTACSGTGNTPPTGFVTLAGSAWTEDTGVCYPPTAFGTAKWDTGLEPDQEAWAEITTVPSTGTTFLINFRIVDNNNRYRAYVTNVSGTNNDTLIIDRIESGTITVLTTVNLGRDIATGDRLGVRVEANAISAGYYANWSGTTEWKLVGSATATTSPATSYIGMGAQPPVTITQFGGGSATPADTTAPTAPSNLTVTPQAAVAIDLAWTASTDAVGVTEYHIFRGVQSNCSDCAQIGTNTTNAFTDNNANPATTYYYRVTALDAALNESSASSIVSGRVPDGVAYFGSSGRIR